MGGGGDSSFAFKMLIFAIVIMIALPVGLNTFVRDWDAIDVDENQLLEDYYNFTGASRGKTAESVWVLTGVYTPFGINADGTPSSQYQYTDDGWLYGSRIPYYAPSQYQGSNQAFDVYRNESNGIYYYANNSADYQPPQTITIPAKDENGNETTKEEIISTGVGHKSGDLYTSVVMDRDHKSNIFFNKTMKYDQHGQRYVEGSSEPFYYSYSGWRYAWQPVSDSWTVDGDGNKVHITATSTSLSLIWYSYYTTDGIAGQLVISGSDSGTAYLTSDQIVSAFDSNTSTARFQMTFNGGVQMGIYIKIDPVKLQEGETVKYCYDQGYWSVMVTSISTESDSYTGTDYTLNVWNIFDTIIKLMTFDYHSLNLSPLMGSICSYVIIIPLYAGLIALALSAWPALLIAGILAAIQTIVNVIAGGWWPFS